MVAGSSVGMADRDERNGVHLVCEYSTLKTPVRTMTQKQRAFIQALATGHCYLSLSDRVDEDVQVLIDCGWAKTWDTIGGFPAIGLTDEGREALRNS